jgi:hypothetical protein
MSLLILAIGNIGRSLVEWEGWYRDRVHPIPIVEQIKASWAIQEWKKRA